MLSNSQATRSIEGAQSEERRLDAVARTGLYSSRLNVRTVEWSGRIFMRYLRGESVLEVGPGSGVFTSALARRPGTVEVLDGCSAVCDVVRSRFPGIVVHHSLIETFRPAVKYDAVVIGHVLEHVEDPRTVLERVAQWLRPGGMVLASVPNARSIHRQAAVLMRLLGDEHDFSESDRALGHRRVFAPDSFRSLFLEAGYRIEASGGYWLKPLSNAQLEGSWTDEMIDAFMELGERYPDIAAELFVVASVADP